MMCKTYGSKDLHIEETILLQNYLHKKNLDRKGLKN